MKKPKGYYVYSIRVDGVVRYIGKGKGLRMYSHMKEVRDRLSRDFKLENIGSLFQRKLTETVMQGAEIVEELLVEGLTDKDAYQVEHDKLKEFVFDGKRAQLWNVIPGSIYTSEERVAYIDQLKRNLSSKDWMIRHLSGRTLEIMTKSAGAPSILPSSAPTLRATSVERLSPRFAKYCVRAVATPMVLPSCSAFNVRDANQ